VCSIIISIKGGFEKLRIDVESPRKKVLNLLMQAGDDEDLKLYSEYKMQRRN
jgi:hypothetical protein